MDLREQVIAEIRKIYDPEIPVNIYELGLIYDVKVNESKAKIIMTLTTPNCPVAESLLQEVKDSAMQVEGIFGFSSRPPSNFEFSIKNSLVGCLRFSSISVCLFELFKSIITAKNVTNSCIY